MPHIHDLIDWCVGVFCVENGRVCLIMHKTLKVWLPPGGHVELNETPDEAAQREFQEETGTLVQLHGDLPVIPAASCTPLRRPTWVDIHPITLTHRHICLYYLGSVLKHGMFRAEYSLFDDTLRWMTASEVEALPCAEILATTRWYAMKALAELAPAMVPVQAG